MLLVTFEVSVARPGLPQADQKTDNTEILIFLCETQRYRHKKLMIMHHKSVDDVQQVRGYFTSFVPKR